MYLFVDCGEPFVEAVARRYGHADLDRLSAKIKYFALADQVDTILHGAGVAPDGV